MACVVHLVGGGYAQAGAIQRARVIDVIHLSLRPRAFGVVQPSGIASTIFATLSPNFARMSSS